jgi:hypothetical protein
MSEQDPFAAGVGGPRPDDTVPDTATPVEMDVGPILARCSELLKQQPGLVFFTILLSVTPSLILTGIDTALQVYVAMGDAGDEVELAAAGGRLLLSVASMLISIWLQLGVVRIFLNLARGGTAELGMLVGQGRHYLSAVAATFLFVIAYMLGLVLLVVPGIIVATGLQFFLYAMVDEDLGPIEALSESWRLTEGHKLTVFLINLVIGLLAVMFCCVTFGLGYILALPLMSLAAAVMYHSLTHLRGPATRA